MPVITNLRKFELRNQSRNGEDFTIAPTEFLPNFSGAVGELLQATYQIDVAWNAAASSFDTWQIGANTITRAGGSFVADGFIVGQTFEFYPTWATYQGDLPEFGGDNRDTEQRAKNRFRRDIRGAKHDGRKQRFGDTCTGQSNKYSPRYSIFKVQHSA